MNYFYIDVCAMKPVRMTTRVWARSQLTNTVSGLDILPFAVGHREATRMLDIYRPLHLLCVVWPLLLGTDRPNPVGAKGNYTMTLFELL